MKKRFSLLLMMLLLMIQGVQALDYLYFSDYTGLRYKAIVKEWQGWEGSGSDLHVVTGLTISHAIVCEPAVGKYVGIITIPETVDFYGDNYVWEGHIGHFDPQTLNVIGCEPGIFEHCHALKKVAFPTSHDQVYDASGRPTKFNSLGVSFKDCTSLLEVERMNLSWVFANQFEGCSSLKKMDLSKTTDIEESAFSGCSSLEELTFKSDVRIRDNAFSDCNAIQKITVQSGSSPEPFNDNVFTQTVYEQAILIVPVGKVKQFKRTNGWKNFFMIYEEGSEPSTDPATEPTDSVTLMANSYSRQYGEDNPTFEYTVVSGKLESGTPTITCAATKTSPVGTYDIIIEKGSVSNKFVTLVNGTLTITKAPLTISVDDYSKVEGEPNPSFTLSYSGFKNGENSSVLTKQPTISCSATTSSAPGTYPITVSGAEAQNYDITYMNGTLTITAKQTPPAGGSNPYVVYDDGTLTFYCDSLRSSRQGTTYDLNSGYRSYPGWYEHSGSIIKAVFDASFADARPTTTFSWFYGCSSLTEIEGMGYLNTSEVLYMVYMFRDCDRLKSLELSNFDTKNVVLMSRMFHGCSSLINLDVTSFDTRNVTDMWCMFYSCKSLTSIDLSNFDTRNVTKMYGMFQNCINLKTIYANEVIWNTDNVTEGGMMFSQCTNLVGGNGTQYDKEHIDVEYARIDKINAPGYLTNKNYNNPPEGNCEPYVVYNTHTLTFYCDDQRSSRQGTIYSLNEGENEPDWVQDNNNRNVEKVVFDASFAKAHPTSTSQWFLDCDYLTEIRGIEYLNTSEVKSMRAMFRSCKRLKSVDVSHFDTRAAENIAAMFSGCSSLESIDVSHFDTNNVYAILAMFYNCKSLKEIDLSSFNTSKVLSMTSLFEGCSNLTTLYLGSEFTSTDDVGCDDVFVGCQSLGKVVFTGDIPSSINSKFFEGVGTADAPATLDVPDAYKANYLAKFDGVMFYSGYFKLVSETGINDESIDGQIFDVYSFSGTMVKKGTTSLESLPKGVYIVNGQKVVVK